MYTRPGCSLLVVILSVVLICCVSPCRAGDRNELAKIFASDGVPHDGFGYSVSLDGSVALIGAPYWDDDGTFRNAAYVYRLDFGSWVEEQKLTSGTPGADDDYGTSVSLKGDVALVGAHYADGPAGEAGAVFVYRFDGSTWVEEQVLRASDAESGDAFGISVSLDDGAAIVGAYDDGSGSAYVFRFDGSSWVEEQKLTPSDGGGVEGEFGHSVTLNGNLALVGSTGDETTPGSAYMYRFDGSSWQEEQKLVPSDSEADDLFGFAVAVDDDLAVVGAPLHGANLVGAAYVFGFDGVTWTEAQRLSAGDEFQTIYGISIALSDNYLLIGAFGDSTGEPLSGAAYRYHHDGSSWVEEDRLFASDGRTNDGFGFSVAMSGSIALAGAQGFGAAPGAAYLFLLESCLDSSVNAGGGDTADVLYIQGSTGRGARSVQISQDDVLVVAMLRPPAGGSGRFALHADKGAPGLLVPDTVLPYKIGTVCFPFLLNKGASPVIVASNLGTTEVLGASNYFGTPTPDPDRATTFFGYAEPLPVGTVLTFQGIIVDPATLSTKGLSATNGIVVTVVP